MTTDRDNRPCPHPLRFAPDRPPWKRWMLDQGMWAAGRSGAGLHRLLGSCAHGRLGILNYHRVAPCIPGLVKPLYNITPERFREQLSGLLARGFAFWPLGKVLQCRAAGEPVPARTAVVTFDDGFASTWFYAYPIARELGVPITVFLATGYLDRSDPFPFDDWGNAFQDRAPVEAYRPLTTAECQRLTETGLVELGVHTHTHQDFRGRPEAFQRDLEVCVDVLRSCFGKREPGFAFPYGSTSMGFSDVDLTTAARRTGVLCGLTNLPALVKLTSDPFTWGRFNVFPWDTSTTLAAKLGGWYSWAHKMKGRLSS